MKNTLSTILFFFFCLIACNAQTSDKSRNKALSFELGKTGLIYNLSFDHKFQYKNYGFRFSVGSNLIKYLSAFSIGGGAYYLNGQKNDHFELGIDINYLNIDEVSDDQRGFVLLNPNYPIKTYYASINLGYRRYGRKNIFRIGISPGTIKNKFILGGYVGYGVIF
jgi:hypothetical protein